MITRLLVPLVVSGLISSTLLAELETKAESSHYEATSSHAEVVAFCNALAEESPRVVHTNFGQSGEKRDLPLLILSDDGITEPNDRLTILCLGNIHAGEVCGKEALLMLARDLARAEKPGLLKNINLLVAPIYNADGNEQMAHDNRPGQDGPKDGMGERHNSQGLDLNRDYVKAQAPETRALLKLLRDWDPEVIIDTHTTNGSHHRYTLTYGGPRHPNTDPRLVDYVRETFLPKVGDKLRDRSGYDSFFYGNFEDNHQRWMTYPALPRYGAHYAGMRQRIGILSEAYAYAPYKDRVLVTRDFVHECLILAEKQRDKISKLLTKASKPVKEVVLKHRLTSFEEKWVAKGVVEKDGKLTDEAKDYLIEYWGKSAPTLSVTLPEAYLIPAGKTKVIELLQCHGVEVQELREDLDLTVTEQTLIDPQTATESFQGHYLVSVPVVGLSEQTRRMSAGTAVVYTDQDLGRLAGFLLEPQAEDGLTTWGLLSANEQGTYPVLRLEKRHAQTLLTGDVRPLEEDRKMDQKITFETLHGEDLVDFNGNTTKVTWLDDSQSFLQQRDGNLERVDAISGRAERYFSPQALAKSLEAIPALTEDEVERFSARTSWSMNDQRTGGLLTYKDDLYHVSFVGEPARRLTSSPGDEELGTFSPDGEYVAFVRNGNLYVVDVLTATERALTTDEGGKDISNGKAAWVYFEELYRRSWKAFWWSPDSRHLAYHRFDESRLPFFHALNTLPLHGDLERMRHPKAGDPNPDIQLGVTHVAGGGTDWVDLSGYTPGTFIISHVGWRPEGKGIYYYMQDRAQTWLDFVTCSSGGGEGERWFRETTKAWVESPGKAHWLKNDDIIIASERTGWRHLYRFGKESAEWQPLTSGKWEVRRVHHLDEDAATILFTGTKDSHIAENLYSVGLDGKEIKRLTEADGSHRVQVAKDGKHFVDTWSDFNTPAQVRLHEAATGKIVRVLDDNPAYKREEYKFAETNFHQIPTEDGFLMEAIVTKPSNFDPTKAYPVWFRTYAGPHAPVVRNSWGRSRMTEQMLAQMGLVVFRMDPRSASGKGAESAWTAYKQLGVQEMKDIEEGINWLTKHEWVDGSRVGMHGHSYGGFMTAYALTHSKLFAAGISGAPVTDWTYYDSIYTERYMNTPQENPDGYEGTSVAKAAENLHGKLLLLHGIMDDNVHLQNATQLVKALQDADKDFDVMFYPTMRHGLYGKHYDRLLVDFIRESLVLDQE